jgi:hypothetical protein
MKLTDLTIKNVKHIREIISEGCEGVTLNVGLNNMMTEEEFLKAESILDSFVVTLQELVEKQNLKGNK